MNVNNINISSYKTFIFDCDGVILNTNFIKKNAFELIVNKFYGQSITKKFIKFNNKNLSKSRYEKFKHLVNVILNQNNNKEIEKLLTEFNQVIKNKLIKSEIATDLDLLFKIKLNYDLFVISASDQRELREVFKVKKLNKFFNITNIFGSPKNKYDNINNLIDKNKIQLPVLCIGDSDTDYFVAKYFGYDFVFMYQWTSLSNWKEFCNENSIKYYKGISNLFIKH